MPCYDSKVLMTVNGNMILSPTPVLKPAILNRAFPVFVPPPPPKMPYQVLGLEGFVIATPKESVEIVWVILVELVGSYGSSGKILYEVIASTTFPLSERALLNYAAVLLETINATRTLTYYCGKRSQFWKNTGWRGAWLRPPPLIVKIECTLSCYPLLLLRALGSSTPRAWATGSPIYTLLLGFPGIAVDLCVVIAEAFKDTASGGTSYLPIYPDEVNINVQGSVLLPCGWTRLVGTSLGDLWEFIHPSIGLKELQLLV
ncbi:hypothetical protein L873DRAFT_1845761 [Choiromyces venosus 120613-1]|uniref:Uncharacterized protein n=1 Tax=Choiromyces venosus 120613-1 TaxID=1336337 RepID=A0A3N4JBY9_9PEZI|nr:hypothetical protein L873DRAFT_1845761 [Choiromyces venosus 120613-1]